MIKPAGDPMSDACAVWHSQLGKVRCELFESEDRAARHAVWLTEELMDGSVMGVQFADGRTVRLDQWPAYAAWLYHYRQAAREHAATPPPVTRVVIDPFEGQPVRVDADAPDWLGG